MEKVRIHRAQWRALHIPITDMFNPSELEELEKAFVVASNEQSVINMDALHHLFAEMDL